jgi:hypothetical protein
MPSRTSSTLSTTKKPKLPLLPEILAIVIKLAISSLHPSNPKHLKALASLCALNHDAYKIVTTRLYHTVILPSTNHLSLFLRSIANNTYLASRVINLWIGDTELKHPHAKGWASKTLAMPRIPNLQRFAASGKNTSVQWTGLSCTQLTVSDLPSLACPIPTLRTLHLINSLLSVDALQSTLHGCPALHTVIFELTERLDFGMLMQLGVTVVRSAPHLRKLTFRIEDFWILHHTMCVFPARLIEEGLEEQMRGKRIGAVWTWELGMDFRGVWLANGFKRRVGKEHRISC